MTLLKQFFSAARASCQLASASRTSSSFTKFLRAAYVMSSNPTIVLSGPSGSGKSTILAKAMKQHPGKFEFSVSHTTRKPRPGEKDGEHYYFVDVPTMQRMIADGEFFEHAEFGGNLYGTSKKTVENVQKSGKICVLDVDIQGVRNFKQSQLDAKYILITPPAIEILKSRLESRGTETAESIAKRLSQAEKDLKAVEENSDLFDYVVVNDELDEAYGKFMNLIGEDLKKHCKQTRVAA